MQNKHQFRKWLWYFSLAAAVAILYKTYTNLDGVVGLIRKADKGLQEEYSLKKCVPAV